MVHRQGCNCSVKIRSNLDCMQSFAFRSQTSHMLLEDGSYLSQRAPLNRRCPCCKCGTLHIIKRLSAAQLVIDAHTLRLVMSTLTATPNPIPLIAATGIDWDSAQVADPLLLGSPTSPSAPAFLSVSPPAPPALPWFLAALGAELLPASLSVPSLGENCYSCPRVDLLIYCDCTVECVDHW